MLLHGLLLVVAGSFSMICPSCLMFDSHKGHEVCRIEEGAKDIRTRINVAAKDGILQFEKTESVLLDVRHAKLTLDENSEAIIAMAEKQFDDLLICVKTRKAKFLQQIRNHYQSQIQLIEQAEADWLRKQQLSQRILHLQGSSDDIKLMEEARKVIQGLKELSQPVKFTQLQLLQNIENDFIVGKHKFTSHELIEGLKQYLKKGRLIVNRIKC